MSAKAFVLIETAVGKTKEVIKSIGGESGVNEVYTVTGPYDIIAVIEKETLSDVGDLVTSKIHAATGVARTVTCLTIRVS